jgi:uncharacterized OB-fold protein
MSKEYMYKFDNINPGATIIRKLDPIVVEKPRAPIHIHTYGGETPFFKGLTEGRLMATKCTNPKCEVAGKEGTYMLPPRVYCPDCLEKMQWKDITELAKNKAKVHTYINLARPGAFNRLPMPCNLISVEIEGVCTVLMSVLAKGEPEIGMRIEPRFKTVDPTYSILDLSWVSVD